MDIQDSVAIVSGGASGLGAATVTALSGRGAKVVIADLDSDRGATLAKELGDGVAFAKVDVTCPEQIEAALVQAAQLGTLRIAVSCAGIGPGKRTVGRDGSPHDLELYQKVVAVNQIGTFNMLRLCAAAMSKSEAADSGERGVIINTASVAAFEGQVGQLAYASSKAAVVGMTLPAARDLGKVGIRVVTIAPGLFDTPMMATLPEQVRGALAEQVVFPKRLGSPAAYAELATHIVTNPYLNGEVIRLDGGLRMQPK